MTETSKTQELGIKEQENHMNESLTVVLKKPEEDVAKYGLTIDPYLIEEVEVCDGQLIASVCISYKPEVIVQVPFSKKVLKKALKDIPYIEELEIALNNTVEDLDNFVKALFVAHINYRAAYIPSQRERFPQAPEPIEGENDQNWKERVQRWETDSNKIEFQIGWEFKEQLKQKPLTSEQFFDQIGAQKIQKLWDEASQRWGWGISDVWEIVDDKIDMNDFILHTDKFKRAVVSMLMINFFDEVTRVFGDNPDYNEFDYELTVEKILELPEE